MEGVQGWRGCASDVIKYYAADATGSCSGTVAGYTYFSLKKILCSRLNGKVTQWMLELIQMVETR
jgi:hypothetical protein